MSATPLPARPRLSAWQLLCYSAPGVPAAMMIYAAGVIVPGYYGTFVGLSAAAIGLVLLVTRLSDVVFDFGAGALSDATRSSIGRRKPWLIAGAIVLFTGFTVLVTPDRGAGTAYFLWASMAFFLGWSLFSVPYDAWGSELAGDYQTRATLFTYRAGAGYVGSLLFSFIPALPIFRTTEYSPEVLTFVVWTVAALLLVTVPLALFLVPRESHATPRRPAALRGFLTALRRNRPLQIYIGSATLNGLSDGVFSALVFIYQASYMGFGRWIWLVLVVYVGANFLALPLWTRVIARIGKHRAWAIGLLLTALCYPPMALLPPGEASLVPMLVLVALAGATYSIANVASPAVLGDVVDYEMLRSGSGKAGTFFAVQALINKFGIAFGAGLAFLLLGAFGYDPGSRTHSATAVFGLQASHLYLPSLLKFGAIALIWRFPLDARALATIRRRLDGLALAAAR